MVQPLLHVQSYTIHLTLSEASPAYVLSLDLLFQVCQPDHYLKALFGIRSVDRRGQRLIVAQHTVPSDILTGQRIHLIDLVFYPLHVGEIIIGLAVFTVTVKYLAQILRAGIRNRPLIHVCLIAEGMRRRVQRGVKAV